MNELQHGDERRAVERGEPVSRSRVLLAYAVLVAYWAAIITAQVVLGWSGSKQGLIALVAGSGIFWITTENCRWLKAGIAAPFRLSWRNDGSAR